MTKSTIFLSLVFFTLFCQAEPEISPIPQPTCPEVKELNDILAVPEENQPQPEAVIEPEAFALLEDTLMIPEENKAQQEESAQTILKQVQLDKTTSNDNTLEMIYADLNLN